MRQKSAIAWAVILVAVSCAGQPRQMYPGPELPLDRLAVLRGTTNAGILGIDGKQVSGFSWSLLPGSHSVWLRVRVFTKAPNVDWDVWTYCRADFEAVAGETYVARVRTQEEVAPGFKETVKVQIGITDSEGVFRAAAGQCREKRPKLNG